MLELVVLGGIIGLQFVICILVSRFVKSSDDFFGGGRRSGFALVTLSIFASWFGSENCLSTAGRVYEEGLVGIRTDPLGYAVCLLIYSIFFARRLWARKVITLGDIIGQRFGVGTEILAGVLLATTSILWAAGQVRSFGHILTTHSPIDLNVAIALASLIAIAYTVTGGLLADVYTDLVQGITLIVGLITVGFFVWYAAPSTAEVAHKVTADRLLLSSPTSTVFENIDAWLVPIAGSLVSQELVSRISGAKSEEVASLSTYSATALYILIGSIPVLLGLFGPQLLAGTEQTDRVLITIAQQYLPFYINLLFSAIVISAILSTVDSTFLASSAVLTRNVIGRFISLPGKRELAVGRLVVVGSGIMAGTIGMGSGSICSLVLTASSFGTAGILVLFVVSLFTNWGSPVSGLPTLLVGMVAMLFFEHVYVVSAPYFWSILISVACFAILELSTTRVSLARTR